jgi:hypothetical protein
VLSFDKARIAQKMPRPTIYFTVDVHLLPREDVCRSVAEQQQGGYTRRLMGGIYEVAVEIGSGAMITHTTV